MAENAFIKIGTALLKHQVRNWWVKDFWVSSAMNSQILAEDKLNEFLGDKSQLKSWRKQRKLPKHVSMIQLEIMN